MLYATFNPTFNICFKGFYLFHYVFMENHHHHLFNLTSPRVLNSFHLHFRSTSPLSNYFKLKSVYDIHKSRDSQVNKVNSIKNAYLFHILFYCVPARPCHHYKLLSHSLCTYGSLLILCNVILLDAYEKRKKEGKKSADFFSSFLCFFNACTF